MPIEKINWVLAENRNKKQKQLCTRVLVTNHPLQSMGEMLLKRDSTSSMVRKQSKTALQSSSQIFVDPLSTVLDGLDPLTSMSLKANHHPIGSSGDKEYLQKKDQVLDDISPIEAMTVVSWETHCGDLRKFTTSVPLTLASSFLTSVETGVVKVQSNIPDRTKGTGQTSMERVRSRLEKLDSLDEGGSSISGGSLREMGGLTQEQFTQHLLALKEEMKQSWNDDQRVKALKIAIQCVKALSLSPPEMFYPCKFAIIADLLDTLGLLVYTRLQQLMEASHSLTFYSPIYEAEETARNWFYKITSIRELLPRIYLEAALLPCYSIVPPEDGDNTLTRLLLMCKGLGDPLVGAYVRTYIVHVGLKYRPKDLAYIRIAVEDFITSCKWGWNGSGIEDAELMTEGVGRSEVVAERVFYPALKWLFQSMSKTQDNLQIILKSVKDSKSLILYLVIKSSLESFPPSILSYNCRSVLQALDLCFAHGENPHEVLISLATMVSQCPPPEELKYEVLNGAWQLVVRIKDNQHYLKAATAWLKFTGKNYSITEVDKILGDVLKRLSKSTSSNHAFYLPLLTLLTCALSSTSFSEELYTLSSFRSLLSVFQRESVGSVGSNNVGELKKLLEAVLQYHNKDFTDASVVELLLSLFATLHDGINALTTHDEKRQIGHLVNTFIRQVNYGRDFEHQLQFYVDARAVFSGLDSVLGSLIQHVLRIQMSTYRVVRGRHTGKTAAFERACSAYSFITIPSLSCPVMKLKLYLLAGAIAMINNCMGQGDACVKSSVKTILDLAAEMRDSQPLFTGAEISSSITYVSAFLVAFPDPPDAVRPLYLFRGLENSLKVLAPVVDPLMYCCINLAVLKAVSTCAMIRLPYHLQNVDGNDTLYGGDPELKVEAEDIGSELLFSILSSLKELIGSSDLSQQDVLCDLLETILLFGDLSDKKLKNLALSLLTLLNNISTNSKLKSDLKCLYDRKTNNN